MGAPFCTWYQESGLAGCFGVGSRLYRGNEITKTTALQTINPFLLKDLNVSYLVLKREYINERDQDFISRLTNTDLFQIMDEVSDTEYAVYRFNKAFDRKQFADMLGEYSWSVIVEQGQDNILLYLDDKPLIGSDRFNLENAVKVIRPVIAKTNIPIANWLSVQAIQANQDLHQFKSIYLNNGT